MSDTDDTDLLLLIPPEFFLVHTPDLEDFDSDCEINFNKADAKDAIVSDLITQVNDLESRICLIESIDRSHTQSSSRNEDSLVVQSVNSLTESDILRKETLNRPLDCSFTTGSASLKGKFSENPATLVSDTSYCMSDKLDQARNDKHSCIDNFSACLSDRPIKTDAAPNIHNTTEIQLGLPHNKTEIESVQDRENHNKLLNEVDTFLGSRSITINNHVVENSPVINETSSVLQDTNIAFSMTDTCLQAGNNCTTESLEEPLALPEVYQLLREMEETQIEMEKKLKLHDPQQRQVMENVGSPYGKRRPVGMKSTNSQTLGIEGIYSKSSKPGYSNSENVYEKVPNIQRNPYYSEDVRNGYNSSNTQVNFLFTQEPITINKNSPLSQNQGTIKPKSPKRTASGYNPIDIVKANFPVKSNFEFSETKDSIRKNINFRRQLNFEDPNIPLRTLKTKQVDQSSNSINIPVDQQSENDKLPLHLPHNVNSRITNHRLEDKFNTLPGPRATYRGGNSNLAFGNDDPSITGIVQQKKSSNNLLSLSELWNKEPTFYSDDPNKLRQKLEEEKYRRQHCEQQIQVLQLRVLEEQEKLAVAIKVDQEKDKAILQITESWRKLNDHWSDLEEQRHNLAKQLQEEKDSSKAKSDELNKKVERWEKEVSQALDLAAGYKEKSETVENQIECLKVETENKLRDLDTLHNKLNEENEKLKDENKTLLTNFEELQERIFEEEELLKKLKAELEKSKVQLLDYEAEVNVLKEQKESFTSKIKDERSRNNILEQKQTALEQALSEANIREKAALDEVKISSERIEVARTELRALYQGQLETVVKEKLQEFQNQLEAAEAALKAELHSKEKQWAEKTNEQCKQLHENYKVELQCKEGSHRDEINKWKVRLMESERLRSIVESRLQEETNGRADIAQRLHSVMETQWREALNIISNPFQNVHEVPKDENRKRWPSREQTSERVKDSRDHQASRSNSCTSLAQTEDVPFCKEGMVTSRSSQQPQDQQLKKYIQMLLERGPGNPIPQHDSLQESLDQVLMVENNSLADKWFLGAQKKSAADMDRFLSSKPPWK